MSFVERGDFVGADMTRKFIQMGMTRAKRYANHKGGRKYDKETGEKLEKWTGEGVGGEEGRKRREKGEASEVFKGVWRRCIEEEGYLALKGRWVVEKREWEKRGGGGGEGKWEREGKGREVKWVRRGGDGKVKEEVDRGSSGVKKEVVVKEENEESGGEG